MGYKKIHAEKYAMELQFGIQNLNAIALVLSILSRNVFRFGMNL